MDDPAPQSSLHDVLPTAGAYVPVPHVLQLDWSSKSCHRPVSQREQAVLSAVMYDPAPQSSLQLD